MSPARRRALPLLLEASGKLAFRPAFFTAAAAWGAALVLALCCFEVVRW